MAQPGNAVGQSLQLKTPVQLARFALEWTAPELFVPVPKLVFLQGPMGSGKTEFVSKVADVLGASDAASPSFALHSRYEGIRGTIDHFDLDRLDSADDLESIGFWDLINDVFLDSEEASRRFVMVEWASRLEQFGMGGSASAWTEKFRVWSFELSGPPEWRLDVKLKVRT